MKKEINGLKELVRKRNLQLFSHPIFEDSLNKEVEELNDEFVSFQEKWNTIKQSKLNKT
jgi:hypothetical protein